MNGWRQLKVGDRVIARAAGGTFHRGVVSRVPADLRDLSGSHATTTRGDFPKAWVRFTVDAAPVPWPVDSLYWPGQIPDGAEVQA